MTQRPPAKAASPVLASLPMSGGTSATAQADSGRGPFLAWPVTRHEFYRTISIALTPALIWGVVIFGSRVLAMVLLAMAACTLTHTLLKRWLKWQRAQSLLYVHCLVSTLVLVALAHPTWPVWVTGILAFALPLILALLGGPGRERVHVAVAMVLAAQYVLLPQLAESTYTGRPDAILAHDRLVMGDIRDQDRRVSIARHWPASWELNGNDAVVYPQPAEVAAQVLDRVSSNLPSADQGLGLTVPEQKRVRHVLEEAFTTALPDMGLFMLGVAPNRVGAASLIAITLAGLYLSYRYILRPRSVLFFLVIFIAATACFTFTPPTVMRVGVPTLWDLLRLPTGPNDVSVPAAIMTLFNFLLLNSDAGFAAVFILALPGTEPLTNRGRRIFLALAAIVAAGLHRLEPTAPAATLVLCALMPAAPLFDRLFTHRSWLNRARA